MHEAGCSRFTVNKSAEPLVFVDVIHQYIHDADTSRGGTRSNGESWQKTCRKGEAHQLTFKFANAEPDLRLEDAHPATPYQDQYLIWLAVDGEGAEGEKKFVLRRNDKGQFDFEVAFS
jgi:hypothetical protein